MFCMLKQKTTKVRDISQRNVIPDIQTSSTADVKICFGSAEPQEGAGGRHWVSTPLTSKAVRISVLGLPPWLAWSGGRVAIRGKALLVERRSALSWASRRKTLSSALFRRQNHRSELTCVSVCVCACNILFLTNFSSHCDLRCTDLACDAL